MSEDEPVNGPRIAAKILSRMKPANRERILNAFELRAPELLKKVQESVFTFEDITQLTTQGIQLVANTVEHQDLVVSLSKAPEPVKKAFLENISERRAKLINEDISANINQVKLTDVEAAQKKILDIIDKLRNNGQIKTQSTDDVWV